MSKRVPNKSPLLFSLNHYNPLVQPYFRKHITTVMELSATVGATAGRTVTTVKGEKPVVQCSEGEKEQLKKASTNATTVCGNAALPPVAVAKSFFHGRAGKPSVTNAPTNMLSYMAEAGWEWFSVPKNSNLNQDTTEHVDLAHELQAVFLRDVEGVLGLENPELTAAEVENAGNGPDTFNMAILKMSAHPHFNSLLKREQASGYTKDYAVYFAEARWKHLQEQTAAQLRINKKARLADLLAIDAERKAKKEKEAEQKERESDVDVEKTPTTAAINKDEKEMPKEKTAEDREYDLSKQHNALLKWMKGEKTTFLSQVKSEPTTALQLMMIVIGGRVAQDSGTLAVQLTNASQANSAGYRRRPSDTESLFSTPSTETEALRKQRFKDYERYSHYADHNVWRLKAAWNMSYVMTFMAWLTLSVYFDVIDTQKRALDWCVQCFWAFIAMMGHGH